MQESSKFLGQAVMISRKKGKITIKNSDNKEEKHFVADLKYPFNEVKIKKMRDF